MTPEEKSIMEEKQNIPETEKNKGTGGRSGIILRMENVSKKYGTGRVLKNCNITLKKGEVMAVIGPEGHGKSTLAKVAAGLVAPTRGSVIIRDVKAGRATNSVVSYQPDIPYFKYDYTVSEILNLYSGFFMDFSYKKAYHLLNHFDISRRTRFENLSTTALFIIQVILVSSRRASLYIFDDPLVHCDPKYRGDIITMIDKCRKYGAVMLLSQTAQGLDDITDKVAFIRHGEIVKEFHNADDFEAEFGDSLLNDVYREVFKHA